MQKSRYALADALKSIRKRIENKLNTLSQFYVKDMILFSGTIFLIFLFSN